MEGTKTGNQNKGGRPKKDVKQDQYIGVKCSVSEKTILKQKAQTLNLTLSEYLRESGLKSQIVMKVKTLPREVLAMTATLNHMAANLNQLAKKRNQFDVLDTFERLELNNLSLAIKALAEKINNWLK